jgi:hypothetical protein
VENGSTYLPNADSNFREYGDNEVFATGKLEDGDGDPITTDKIAKNIARNNDIMGNTKQIIPTNYRFESKMSKQDWGKKHKLNEDNQDLVNRQFNIGSSEAPRYVSYTNLTTIKNELETERQRMGNNFPQNKQEELNKINRIYSVAKSNSKNIRNSKMARGERVLKQHTKQNNNGKAHTKKNNGPIITYEN